MTNPGRRLIVELGCGSKPFSTRVAPGHRMLQPDEEYVGIDTFGGERRRLERVQEAIRVYEEMNGLSIQLSVRMANADNLPFSDEEVDEIIAANFFGDHRTPPVHNAIAREIGRVLKRNGMVSSIETLTPDRMPVSELRALLGRVGLVQINEGSEYDFAGINQYAEPPVSPKYGAYLALFTFPPEKPPPVEVPGPPVGTVLGSSLIMQVCAQVMTSVQMAMEGAAMAISAQEKLLAAQDKLEVATQSTREQIIKDASISLTKATDHLEKGFEGILGARQNYETYVTAVGCKIEPPLI